MTISTADISQKFQEYFTVPSGLPIENPIFIEVVDAFGQVVFTDSESVATVRVSPSDVGSATVSKNTKVKCISGKYEFNDFIV